MNKLFVAIVIIALAVWGAWETISKNRLSANVPSIRSIQQQNLKSLQSKEAELEKLQEKLVQMVEVLNGSTAKLSAEKSKSARYQKQIEEYEMTQDQKADRKKLMDEQPFVKREGVIIFPRLLSSNGNTLLLNAEYRKTFGRKIIFKTGLDMFTYDIDEMHPGALLQLGIDSDQAKKTQATMDKQKQMLASLDAQAAQAKIEQDSKFIDQQIKQNTAQAKIDEANRRQQALEDRQQQLVDAEKTRAAAAMKAANAAMISAANGL